MCYVNNFKLVAIETIDLYCHLFSNTDVPRTCTVLGFFGGGRDGVGGGGGFGCGFGLVFFFPQAGLHYMHMM